MQLRIARLCLDCEEVHDSRQCPVCASETFAYLSRWVASPERRAHPRVHRPVISRKRKAVVGLSVLGLGIVGLTQWLARGRKQFEEAAARGAGELK